MKPKIAICAIISAFALLTVSAMLLHHHISAPAKYRKEIKNSISPAYDKNNSDTAQPETSEVISENPQIENYILQLDPFAKKVFLTVKYKDGSELISHIKTIDPDFLEAEDVHLLEEGITLSSKEDMFILIEDYSS